MVVKMHLIDPADIWHNYWGRKPAFLAEVALLQRFAGHPNVVALLGVCDLNKRYGEEKLWIVLEYAARGSLRSNVVADVPLLREHAANIVAGVASALEHLHAHEWVFRRLSPTTVVLADDFSPKLVDFHYHGRVEHEETFSFGDDAAYFMAPEIADVKKGWLCTPTPTADAYSFAMLVAYVWTHVPPECRFRPKREHYRKCFDEWVQPSSRKYDGPDADANALVDVLTRAVFAKNPEHRSTVSTTAAAAASMFA